MLVELKDKVSYAGMIFTVVDELPESEKRKMYVNGYGRRMKKIQAFNLLKVAKVEWDEEVEEVFLTLDNSVQNKMTKNAYDNFFTQGIFDSPGSPAEKFMINMLMASYPWVPRSFVEQIAAKDIWVDGLNF